MRIHALIADDEPLARERLRFLLADDPDVVIVGECRNGDEVVASLRSQQTSQPVDVLFLDIQMPGRGGLEAIEAIQQIQKTRHGGAHLPITVFVTAHDQYAIRAFELHALDYLTKPVEPERLRSTLARVKDRIASNHALQSHERLLEFISDLQANGGAQSANNSHSAEQQLESKVIGITNPPTSDYPKRLLIPNGQKDTVVNVNEIEWIEAADYYACLHVGARCFMLRETVKQLATTLNPGQFVRIHRSIIVNMDFVCEIAREGRGEGAVILTRGQRLRMSKAGWQNLVAASRTSRSASVHSGVC
jgi:two-component system LytT family response regulator